MDFVTVECVLWIVDLWCFYHLFGLSFWRHPFTAKPSIVEQVICNATFLQICSDEETNSSYILAGLRVSTFYNKYTHMYTFGVNNSIKTMLGS